MTERLYYTDSFLREFEARVISCGPGAAGKFHVVLDRTAFYPTSGGQPNDTGRLCEASVLEVVEREDGAIVHVTDLALALGAVRGAIDWGRRFDHMQQHTGQHLLSAAFVELFKFPTVSFHLGSESSSIDLGTSSLSAEHAAGAEQRTNQIIFEDRPVEVRFGTREELAASGVRKDVDREGVLRAISVKDLDLQPCGGTHVERTGQVGLVLLRKIERQKQNWRVEFVCGERAMRAARADYAALNESARLLTCGLPEVPAMLGKALEERKQAQRSRQDLLERLAAFEVEEMLRADEGEAESAKRIIVRVFTDADAVYLRMLATRLAATPGVQALLATRAGGHIVFAQSPGFSADMNALLRECIQSAGGKGGGMKDFAQGNVPGAERLDELLAAAAAHLK
ncbi:MAG: DHHA1 domain-containing protein [Acidobacteria bacterium]|nr:DHHA1 domain-containing protein [Acidobacteriota bacterium]MCL5288247.1 DHHA1 domain-containing protein [Acidobacteriota bacterium]